MTFRWRARTTIDAAVADGEPCITGRTSTADQGGVGATWDNGTFETPSRPGVNRLP
jgi:hypothetical protein